MFGEIAVGEVDWGNDLTLKNCGSSIFHIFAYFCILCLFFTIKGIVQGYPQR